MPGIRVDTPVGDGWEYTFDNVTWQTSNVFRNYNGQPFIEDATYTVFCRNLVTNEKATNSIIYKSPGNSTSKPQGLDDVLAVGDSTTIAPHFDDGLFAHLEKAPDGEIIQRVGIGADGKFYLLDDSALDELDTPAKKDAFLQDLLDSMSPETKAKWCEINASCPLPPVLIPPVLDQFDFFELIPNESGQLPPSLDQFNFFELVPNEVVVIPPSTPDYMARFDQNTCGVNGGRGLASGWALNVNKPGESVRIRVVVDGVFEEYTTANRTAPNVRDYLIQQNRISSNSTYANYAWLYEKPARFEDGAKHKWEFFVEDSQVKATSDVGALEEVTCGAVTPTIIQQTIGGVTSLFEGEEGEVWVNNIFSNNGAQGFYLGDGTFVFDPLYPDGVTITMISKGRARIKVPADCTPRDVTRPLRFIFSQERSIVVDFTFKNITTFDPNANPASLDGLGDFHGNGFTVAFGSNPSNFPPGYTVAGQAAGTWDWSGDTLCQTATGNTPDQRMIYYSGNGSQSSYNHSTTLAKVKPTALTNDSRIGVGLRYTFAADQSIGYCFVIKDNNQVWFIHNGFEGGPAFSYATEVGTWYWMKMNYQDTDNNTCKLSAKIWKAGEVEPRAYMFFWENQARTNGYPALIGGMSASKACFDDWYDADPSVTTTPPVDPPTTTPFIEKFAVIVKQLTNAGVNTYVNVELIYKTNLPVGTQIEDIWPEIWAVGNQQPEWLPTAVTSSSVQFPDGFKDYNVEMLYTYVPVSFLQSHTVHHVKVRQKGTTTILLETTFDLYGMSVGQTKQFFPI